MLGHFRQWQIRGIFITTIVFTVYALTALFSSVSASSDVAELDTDVTPLSGQSLVNSVLGGGLVANDIASKGTIYTFSHGLDIVGIDSGIILETSGRIPAAGQDPDLNILMDYPYGGDTASLEFTIQSTGTLLNFNYVFVSTEFDQQPRYNDIFGLFVSVNGGAYENIATIPVATGEVPVSINSLRSGINHNNEVTYTSLIYNHQYSLFNSTPININNSVQPINGVSNVFNAQKSVQPGDIVKIKFAIADVSDAKYDSYVLIEADSLSFEEQMAKINYEREVIERLYSGRTYEITDGDDTYVFTSSTNGEISLSGTDSNGKEYDFIGDGINIVRKGIGTQPDSNPQHIDVPNRPDAPADVRVPTNSPDDGDIDIADITESSIIVAGNVGQEYRIDLVNWYGSDASGNTTFSSLSSDEEYTVYTRYAATESSFHSEPSDGSAIITHNMVKDLNYVIHDYSGLYDGLPHHAYIDNLENAEAHYSEGLNGNYSDINPEFAEPGDYVVYYQLTKDNYYPAYGAMHVIIKDYDVINVTDEEHNYGHANLLHSSAELKQMFEYDNETKESLADAHTPAEINLVSTDATDSIAEEIPALLATELEEDEQIGKIIDLKLYQKLLGDAEELTDLTNPVQISLTIPDTLVLADEEHAVRAYRVLRLHNGVISEINAELDNNHVLMFSTDKLSYYVITYHDITYVEPTPEPSHEIGLSTAAITSSDNSEISSTSSENDATLIPNTASLLVPDTGEMERTLDAARGCAITTIVIGSISTICAAYVFARFRAYKTRSKNLKTHS